MNWTLASIGLGGLVLAGAFPLVRALERGANAECVEAVECTPVPVEEIPREDDARGVTALGTELPSFLFATEPAQATAEDTATLQAEPELPLDPRYFSRVLPSSWRTQARFDEVAP